MTFDQHTVKFQGIGLGFKISHLIFNVSQPGLLYMVKLL